MYHKTGKELGERIPLSRPIAHGDIQICKPLCLHIFSEVL